MTPKPDAALEQERIDAAVAKINRVLARLSSATALALALLERPK